MRDLRAGVTPSRSAGRFHVADSAEVEVPVGRRDFLEQEALVYIERGSCFRIDAAAGDERGRFIVGMGL